jgi:D-arabinose 1-dehydrogenase-like Zn-dependent alcohol dehydrogenase
LFFYFINKKKKKKMTQKITTFPTAATPGKFSEKVVDAPHLEPYEVLIKMLACGICHTDCAFLGAGEGLILGHEPVGRVVALGSEVSRLKVGDIVGTSYLLKTCLDCIECNSGNDNMCEKRVMFPGEGNLKYNGFADHKIADSR